MPEPLRIAVSEPAAGAAPLDLCLLPALANRHGLIAGATGTGKTVTLQVMAERFSAIGVPVFMADVKGDLTGIARPGTASPRLRERLDGADRHTVQSEIMPYEHLLPGCLRGRNERIDERLP